MSHIQIEIYSVRTFSNILIFAQKIVKRLIFENFSEEFGPIWGPKVSAMIVRIFDDDFQKTELRS